MPDQFLGLEGARPLATRDYLVTQRIVTAIVQVLGMGVVHGGAGLGKTFAVRSACERRLGVEVAWFDFPGRTTTKELAQSLIYELTGILEEAPRKQLQRMLLDLLAETRRLIVVDEAQRLYDESIEYLRHLYDRPTSRFALLFVGGDDCWRRISRYPMVRSRVYQRRGFSSLDKAGVVEHIPRFHPLYEDVDRDLLLWIDAEQCHGNLRAWVKFTLAAEQIIEEAGLGGLDEGVVRAVFALTGAGEARDDGGAEEEEEEEEEEGEAARDEQEVRR